MKIRYVAAGFAVLFFLVWITTHVPAFNDARGYNFGLFKIDPIDDVVHLLTALIGFLAAWHGARSSRIFLVVFGALYALDALTGMVSQLGLLDLSLIHNTLLGETILNPNFGIVNWLVNMPHIVISAAMIYSGVWGWRRG
ncbi:MAG: DUF4383 domain-containing protein [Candidatus Kaiserbacteria bacterium]|nr:DUF4383 domain-containing protein [Candidatus Kaiserbacteria bacterium]